MPELTFEGLGESLARLPEVIRSIPDILRDPSANPVQAAILLGIVVALVLIVLVSVVLVIMRPSREEEELLREELGEDVEIETVARPISWPTILSVVVLVALAIWVITGVTTSSADVCSSCHRSTAHTSAPPGGDPHASVACVSCHEGGGRVARLTVNLATRVRHVVAARIGVSGGGGYGRPVASDGCANCHRGQIEGVFYNKKQGVRVSHEEPLAAGAQCVDCHTLANGAVSSVTVGMAPCLRCHDGKRAKAECNVCHVGDPSGAIRSSVTTGSMASVLVPNPQCDGCHTDMSSCDACHGISMPHSLEFRAYGHAREAATDIWSNGSAGAETCAKCHYPGHNNCIQDGCHGAPFPSHPSPAWRDLHKLATWSGSQNTCACHEWKPWDHNGMNYCQICHPVKPKGAQP